jgi:hypothetical protein
MKDSPGIQLRLMALVDRKRLANCLASKRRGHRHSFSDRRAFTERNWESGRICTWKYLYGSRDDYSGIRGGESRHVLLGGTSSNANRRLCTDGQNRRLCSSSIASS